MISIIRKGMRQPFDASIECSYLGRDQGRETTANDVAHLV